MQIFFATPFYYPELKFGGPPRKIHSLAKGLAAQGHSVTVLTFNSEDRNSGQLRTLDGVAVQHLRWFGKGLRQMPVNGDVVRKAVSDADVLHCFGIYNLLSPISARVARRSRTPFVLEPLGMYPPRAASQLAKRAYNLLLTKRMMRHAAAVIAASKAEAAELAVIADPKKIVYRRNGIDVWAFENLPQADTLRERWAIAHDEKVILYVGRISPIKNLGQLVLAFAHADFENARLVLVGPLSEPNYEAKLRQLINERSLSERVTIVGPLYDDEQKAALRLADLFVLPSLNESFGNAAAEAVAAGVPVLLTETCGIAPLIHKRAGLAVQLGVASLADGIRMMLDPGIRDRMTARREEVKRELSWDEPVAQTIALYERILAEKQKH